MEHENQIERIKKKLIFARKKDVNFQIFGAESHKYHLSKPASILEVNDFETKYNIELPKCFKSFLTEVGNGGIEYPKSIIGNSAAGPNFGIYKLNSPLIDIVADTKLRYLESRTLLNSKLVELEWEKLVKKTMSGRKNKESDEEYEECVAKIYSGILTIGYCGCSGYQGILLNGNEKGRVIYFYDELDYCPHFAEELNFLDWYENWLDEIINKNTEPVMIKKTWWKIW